MAQLVRPEHFVFRLPKKGDPKSELYKNLQVDTDLLITFLTASYFGLKVALAFDLAGIYVFVFLAATCE